jgi:hypothetical protein
MQSDAMLEQVRLLRAQGQAPKQIARTLGIRPTEATRLVRAAAAQASVEEPALVGCWISPTWSTGLGLGDHPDWPADDNPAVGTDGLVSVLVARRHRFDKVTVCGYLTDVYCLGVKNALGPETMDDLGLKHFVQAFFDGYHDDPIEAPLELAQEVVFGSVDYARGLGFDPHPDFEYTKGHLGTRTGPSTITFGKDGKPYYISGPRDNPAPVIRKLETAVGEGNYDYIAVPIQRALPAQSEVPIQRAAA